MCLDAVRAIIGEDITIMLKKLKESFKNPGVSTLVINLLAAVAFIGIYVLICAKISKEALVPGFIVIVAYIVTSFLIIVLSRKPSDQKSGGAAEEITPFLSNITLEMIVNMYNPVMVCRENGTALWYNAVFADCFNIRNNLSGADLEAVSGLTVDQLMSDDSEFGVPVNAAGRPFSVKGYQISLGKKEYYITLWKDEFEIKELQRRIADDESLVAYIIIDNIEELQQYTKDGSRSAANEVGKALGEWAAASDGIIKEYDRDRYLFIFRAECMKEFIDNKFDILDKIREIRVSDNSISVTVSMGISQISGTLAEKERTAREALEMALQRGGDQVVVKTGKSLDFYGGKSKTVQKRTNVRARVVANELAAFISKSSNVILMAHKNVDFDGVGACVGIARMCMFCGVRVNIIANKNDPNFQLCYNRLAEIGDYNGKNPDRNIVFVSPQDALELVKPETLLIILDVNNHAQFESQDVEEICKKTIVIDHHRKTAEFSKQPVVSYIEPSASSACELVAEILEQSLPSGSLLEEEANLMYAGILLDTKQFTRNTGVRTFGAALYLRREDANPTEAMTLFKTNLQDFISEAKFESNAVIYRKVIAISLNDDENNTAADRISAAKAADKLLTVFNVLASFALCRIGDVIHISARSLGTINVQAILEKLEGGGHYHAAATQLNESMEDALNRLKAAIDEYLDSNAV